MPDDAPPAEFCVANIGPRERARRRRLGITMAIVGAGVTAALVVTRVPRAVRLVTFIPFCVSAFGFFQAREKT